MRAENRERIEFLLSPDEDRGRWLINMLQREPNVSETIRQALAAWYDDHPAPSDPMVAELARELIQRDRQVNALQSRIAELESLAAQLQAQVDDLQFEYEYDNGNGNGSGLLSRLRRE